MIHRFSLLVLLAQFYSHPVSARPDYFDIWRSIYPSAQASELDCQLCHQRPDGGDGWNGYGFDVRTTFFDVYGGTDMQASIRFIENLNSDQDTDNLDNKIEIDSQLYPGWVNSETNIIYFKDGTFLLNQAPPQREGLTDLAEPLCFPIVTQSGSAIVICI